MNFSSISFFLSVERVSYDFPKVLGWINLGVAILLSFLYLYQNIYLLVAIFTKDKKMKPAKKMHKYAYLICAHDEDKVVGNLVDSLVKQNYPKELMKIFVVADNCSDRTADVAREAGAIVFERQSDQKGKSWAMDYAIKRLLSEYKEEGFEAMFVFDADNLVTPDYTLRMNEMFDAGFKVSTSFRDSKNFNDSWVSAGASMCFYRECDIIHHSRSLLGVGTYISGTGYYISFDILEEMGGWNYHTFVEDIEFSCDCANKRIKIGYCADAKFYDEQPKTFKASVTQRLRWCKGTHQCYGKYAILRKGHYVKPLLYSQAKFEMRMHISPLPIISFLWTVSYMLLALYYTLIDEVGFLDYAETCLATVGWFCLVVFGVAFVHAVFVTIKRHKMIQAPLMKQIWYCFTFPVYAATFIPISLVALFKKVAWKKVEHTESKTIEDMK